MPYMGKAAAVSAVAIGVIGTLTLSSVLLPGEPAVRPIDQLALAEGDHDRLIVLDAASQYVELANILSRDGSTIAFSNAPTTLDVAQISEANHTFAAELPAVRALQTADG